MALYKQSKFSFNYYNTNTLCSIIDKFFLGEEELI
jgi:hypothetical protein